MENEKVRYLINMINNMDIKDKLRLAICMSQSKWSGLIYNNTKNYEKFDENDNEIANNIYRKVTIPDKNKIEKNKKKNNDIRL